MPENNQPPAGAGNARLAIATLAMSPAIAATYAQAVFARRRYATDTSARRALETLGLHDVLAGATVKAHTLGSGKSNAVVAVALRVGSQPVQRLVIKHALAFGSLLGWGARHFGANYVYAAATRGSARISREAAALRTLLAHGIAVPRCLAADPRHSLLALEWIDGTPAAHALHRPGAEACARQMGELIRRVHAVGVTLGDGHPGNMMIEGDTGRLVLFDLEFAECTDSTPTRRGFDVAYARALMPSNVLQSAMLEAYGPLAPAEQAAYASATDHLQRFERLLAMERARWVPTDAG